MFSSFKLPSLRLRRHSESTTDVCDNASIINSCGQKSPKVIKKKSKTPVGTPSMSSRRHHRRSSDAGTCPSIASLRPGSVAYNSDQLMPGDRIHNINGINTSRLRSEDVTTLLTNVDERALLDVEYSIPDCGSQNSLCITSKVTNIVVEREDGSLGITLRGGVHGDPQLTRSLVITHVRPHGPAHKTGLIKTGDRLLKVDNQCLTNKTLLEAQKILTQTNEGSTACTLTTLTIEYDISIMESVKYATGPLLVEIERRIHEELGLVLQSFGKNDGHGVFIEKITPASIADRCGALHVGDQILAINDMYLENMQISREEVMCLLHNTQEGITKLQILPYHTATIKGPTNRSNSIYNIWQRSGLALPPSTPSLLSSFSTINSRKSRVPHKKNPKDEFQNNFCGYHPQLGVCHTETLNITLCSEGLGYGLTVGTEQSAQEEANIVITDIELNSISDRCGCLQIGDRLLSINRQPNLTVQEINAILNKGYFDTSKNVTTKLELHVEFDVTDSIVPSSGIFTVKLARQTSGLGITITASKSNPDDPFIISDIRRGSSAHRIGTLQTGDRLLAIDNQNLDHTTLDAAFNILQNSPNDIVTLKIEKVETASLSPSSSKYLVADHVVYTVELIRYGGPLGITIAGSEDCLEPIVLSRLIEGGLAEKTGALHVGDRILAINGESLVNRPLSDAIRLLQCSGDRVQLKISRSIKESQVPCEEIRGNYPSPGVQSIDSAVESWTGSTLIDNNKHCTSDEIPDNNSLTESVSSATIEPDESQAKPHTFQNLQYYSDTDDVFRPSPLPLPNYNYTNSLHPLDFKSKQRSLESDQYGSSSFGSNNNGSRFILDSNFDASNYDIYHVILYKDAVYDDYGFSVSDGLYEKGVYINRIRKGGPADIVALLRPFDRILQVNDTKTQDFDCCLTVPLIASAGDRIELVVARSSCLDNKVLSWITEEQDNISTPHRSPLQSLSTSQSTITKTL